MITFKINLSALTHVKMTMKGKSGQPVLGLFIPIEPNNLFLSEKTGAVYLDLVAFELKKLNDSGDTHLVKQSLSKEKRASMTREDQDKTPILGNLKAEIGGGFAETNNAASPDIWDSSETDKPLPF